jgi:hypothetical protein
MNDVFVFVLAAFACFRLAELFSFDDGPFDALYRLRLWMGGYDFGENGEPVSTWGRLINCPFCLGIWFALLIALVLWGNAPIVTFVLYWLALAGAQAALQGLVGRK